MTAQATTLRFESRTDFHAILKDDVRFSTESNDGAADAVNGWFDRLMLQSGMQTKPVVWLMFSAVTGLGLAGFAFLLTERLLITSVFLLIGLMFPQAIALVLRSRRQKQIMLQLPAMAEELARAARTGRSVESALQTVAADTPTPLGDELRLAVRRTEMGLDLGAAVQDLPERTGVPALTMFTSAIKVHQETGGDLIQVLERLAAAIRDRLHFLNRLRAATVASRLGAVMMIIIPPLIVMLYLFRDPTYLQQLTSSFAGRLSLGTAITLQFLGAFFVFRILNRTARF